MENSTETNLKTPSWQKRLLNLIIDLIMVFIVYKCVMQPLHFNSEGLNFELCAAIVLYYFTLESLFGKTAGKLFTQTKVVSKFGGKPELPALLGKSLCRLNLFEAFSYLNSDVVGWHDNLSDTRVINDSEVFQLEDEEEITEQDDDSNEKVV